jgi:cytochrome c heme-lyase
MNEATWQQVLEWEKLHPVEGQGREPKLLRFLGRPDELSPKARLKALFGHTEPFDRHDWIVDRGGEEVRYVIDYYHDEAGAPQDKTPQTMRDFHAIKSIKTDVRPALDSVGSVVDRVFKMPFYQLSGKTEYRDLPFFPEKKTVAAEVMQIEKIKQTWQTIRNECEQEKDKLMTCQSEKDCENASISLQRCTAGVVCPKIAADFDRSIQAQPFDAEKTDRVYTSMVKCLELFEIDSKKAFQQVNKK